MTAKKNQRIRVGIWGIGRAGFGMHLPEIARYSDKFEVVAACDIDPTRFEHLLKSCPNAKTYTDGEAFLADPKVELVAVAVRSPQHVDYAIRALKAGKYVFCEKPVALTLAAFDKLARAAAKYPGKLYLRHNRRFEPAFNHLREIMDSGVLGEIFEIKICRDSFSFRKDWQSISDCGGGQLNNWGPHIIDQSLRLLESPVKSVWSKLRRIHSFGPAEDHVKIVFTGKNGRIVDMEISDSVAIPAPIYTVYGSRGTLIGDDNDFRMVYVEPSQELPTGKPNRESPPLGSSFGTVYKLKNIRKTIMVEPANGEDTQKNYLHLYEAIREGKPYPITIAEAREVVKWSEQVKKDNPDFRPHADEFGK
ncbi:MAG: Gfo/Idh/MocA family oxidoreductase [Victivallales bacterium]|nr:Gfo/Idh/MocA family oxidoreductase [Victivallales bacterium]